ncbi:hypothetical protein sos41_16010 [Alphaproteobacteria bacterium SO-S41]|nr:hypothetical protein sos41_16010 [Alphaproteobacteria bacterium SO-S41]
MPEQTIIVVSCVIAAFSAFGLTLAGVIAWTAFDPAART